MIRGCQKVVSKRVVLADAPRNESRNKGTFGCSPRTTNGTRVRSHVPPERKPERGHMGQNRPFTKPPFYKTALLSPQWNEAWRCPENSHNPSPNSLPFFSGVRTMVVSKKVVLADVPGPQNRNEGTKKRREVPIIESTKQGTTVPKTGTRAHSPKPPLLQNFPFTNSWFLPPESYKVVAAISLWGMSGVSLLGAHVGLLLSSLPTPQKLVGENFCLSTGTSWWEIILAEMQNCGNFGGPHLRPANHLIKANHPRFPHFPSFCRPHFPELSRFSTFSCCRLSPDHCHPGRNCYKIIPWNNYFCNTFVVFF